MELTPERRAALLAYCRIDDLLPEEAPIFEGMYWAAVAYMAGAGVLEPERDTPRWYQYDLCVKRLVLDSWDRRGASESGKTSSDLSENPAFRKTLNQLKRTEPVIIVPDVSDSDTSGG